MSATEQQQHPQDPEDPKDRENLFERVEHPGDDDGPDVMGHMGKKGASVRHRGSV